ncbi:MAG: hypothetical protein OEZ68_09415 [Gammaproteobacteria bacterium]|nr:hypothetical protein [Gammaproteobacteria bacterium]MDH5801006.1 hypothetical protein [Gammaproteobacteria bacterium]
MLTMKKKIQWFVLLGLLLGSMNTMADVLSIPDADSDPSVVLPDRGMSMDEVTAKFGEPLQVIDAIGKPPITRWMYDQFTVHFEYQYVIHAFKKRKTAQE